jgi:hypothetical protein
MHSGLVAKLPAWRSLSTQVTLLTLAVFLVGVWSLAFYASQLLRQDMTRLLGEQQFSTASALASQVNSELDLRLNALQALAANLGPALLSQPAALQASLEHHSILALLFNGGAFVTGLDGTASASVPVAAGRVGLNFLEQKHVAGALQGGKSGVGDPRMGKALKTPVFGMAAPIRDGQGKVIGALVGVTTLAKGQFSGPNHRAALRQNRRLPDQLAHAAPGHHGHRQASHPGTTARAGRQPVYRPVYPGF